MSATQQILGTYGSTAAPPESSVLVADAGTVEVNGTYTYRGINEGKPYYNVEGEGDSISSFSMYWDGNNMLWIINGSTQFLYRAFEDVAYPWEATFTAWDGDAPAPTVTESP